MQIEVEKYFNIVGKRWKLNNCDITYIPNHVSLVKYMNIIKYTFCIGIVRFRSKEGGGVWGQ